MKLPTRLIHALSVFCTVSAVFLVAGSAGAVLPDAISYEYFGLNFASNIRESNTVGTLDYTGQPGCGGICRATTQLGVSPSISATVNEVLFAATGGGAVIAQLAYYVEYVDAPGTYLIDLYAVNGLYAPDGASVSAHVIFGPAGPTTTSLNNFAAVTFEEAECLHGCPQGGYAVLAAPFIPDHQVAMVANTPYLVRLDLKFSPGPSGVQIGGWIVPGFTTTSGGAFAFSPGVVPVPEPGFGLSLMSGMALLAGLRLRSRRRHSH